MLLGAQDIDYWYTFPEFGTPYSELKGKRACHVALLLHCSSPYGTLSLSWADILAKYLIIYSSRYHLHPSECQQ
jgi:hypothetical protein